MSARFRHPGPVCATHRPGEMAELGRIPHRCHVRVRKGGKSPAGGAGPQSRGLVDAISPCLRGHSAAQGPTDLVAAVGADRRTVGGRRSEQGERPSPAARHPRARAPRPAERTARIPVFRARCGPRAGVDGLLGYGQVHFFVSGSRRPVDAGRSVTTVRPDESFQIRRTLPEPYRPARRPIGSWMHSTHRSTHTHMSPDGQRPGRPHGHHTCGTTPWRGSGHEWRAHRGRASHRGEDPAR